MIQYIEKLTSLIASIEMVDSLVESSGFKAKLPPSVSSISGQIT